jgi:signal transduction histidine kinase
MPTSIWGGPESDDSDQIYPLSLLKYFLRQMIQQFDAHGACIALLDENVGQMRIQAHMRLCNVQVPAHTVPIRGLNHHSHHLHNIRRQGRRITDSLFDIHNPEASSFARAEDTQPALTIASPTLEFEDITSEQCELFSVGTYYARGQDLIGQTWHKNEAYTLSYNEYLTFLHSHRILPSHADIHPTTFLVVPVREVPLAAELPRSLVLGVVVLYQVTPGHSDFSQQCSKVLLYADHIALYLQNCYLQHSRRRTTEYLRLLQGISTVFPSSVQLADLVKSVYHFTMRVVNISSMLLTIYDRDLNRLYDVFAIRDGKPIEGLAEQPLVRLKEERPVWCRVVQRERGALAFSPAQDIQKTKEYEELLTGVCGDQRQAASFLLLPMKMFSRVIGTLSITSTRPNAYQPEEIQVLETMVQIVAVNIENARLYERDRHILQEANQRESELAEINSALQAISSVLNITQLLNNLVESVAQMLKAPVCVFLQPGPSGDVLIAQALYAPSSVRMIDDGSGMPVLIPPRKDQPDKLITMIELPFKDPFLKQMVNVGFYYLDPPKLEELAQGSNEAGSIFLQETGMHSMLILPMNYQTEFLGFLGVGMHSERCPLRPKEVGTLLAISAQAAGAIRNAQLFAETQEAYAELERMSKLKDEFLVTASHELRTPLTAIHGYAGRLKRQASRATPQQILRFATQITIAAQQLSDLVSNMTEAAQIGAIDKNQDLHIEPVQLHAAAEIAQDMLSLREEHEIVLDIPQDLWITGDAPRVRQVLTNLLENASKYSLPQTAITVSAQKMLLSAVQPFLSEDQVDHALLVEKGDFAVVLVRVKDLGPGVMAEDQACIFEKFVRAPRSLTTPVRGSGLGLYIARRFVEAMDGKLWLECSVPNEGATFSFYLPWIETPVEPNLEE